MMDATENAFLDTAHNLNFEQAPHLPHQLQVMKPKPQSTDHSI